jgi:hypothetical protein
MNEFQEGPDKLNTESSDKPHQPGKPNTLLDLLIGTGISAAAYALIWFASTRRIPIIAIALICLVVLAVFGFLTVKFFRTAHTAAAVIMVILMSPGLFALLLFGACSLMFSPF